MRHLVIIISLLLSSNAFGGTSADWSTLQYLKQDDWSMWAPIVKKAPVYPKKLFDKGIEGCVNIYFNIRPNGKPGTARVLKSIPEGAFDKYALKALSSFRYRASETNSEKAPIITNAVFTFTKEKDEKGMAAWAEKCKQI